MATGFAAVAEGAATSAARGGVHTLRDDAGNIVRTGRSNDLAARRAAHANGPVLGEFALNPEYRTDVYAEQRELEQILYDRYPEARVANGGFNAIRAVSPTNPNFADYIQAAFQDLDRLSGG